ncbi:MAG: hypothetical protein ACLU2J_01885 [Clostridia bacterium]
MGPTRMDYSKYIGNEIY